MSQEAPRLVARRDSATTILRKLGVNSRDYNLFIKADRDGFIVDVHLAKQHVGKVAEQTADKKTADPLPWEDDAKPAKATKKAAKPAPAPAKNIKEAVRPRDGKMSVSDTIRRLIGQGLDNAAIWAQIKAEFNLDDKKRHYPAWYRAQMRRTGALGLKKAD